MYKENVVLWIWAQAPALHLLVGNHLSDIHFVETRILKNLLLIETDFV